MLGLLFNCIWRIIKCYFFILGVLTFCQSPLGWLSSTVTTTLAPGETDRFRDKTALRYLLLMNHELLARQIAEGSGPELKELRAAVLASSGHEITLESLRAILGASDTALDFANKVLDHV